MTNKTKKIIGYSVLAILVICFFIAMYGYRVLGIQDCRTAGTLIECLLLGTGLFIYGYLYDPTNTNRN